MAWQEKYQAKLISSLKEFKDLLRHNVDVVWLWDHRYYIYDHVTKLHYIFSCSDYPHGDDKLYKTPFDLTKVCSLDHFEYGRVKVQNGLLTSYFPLLLLYTRKNKLNNEE